jgi:prepilin-type N-terminal cleavage/methylation domain-containing protein
MNHDQTTEAARQGAQAFTFVELLVVLAVIALLALVAVPALSKTGPDAQVFQCRNNLRQWALAMQMYANENSDTMPHDGMGVNGDYPDTTQPYSGSRDLNQWFDCLPSFLGEQPLYDYTVRASSSAQYNSTVIPFPGGVGRIYECPSAWMSSSDLMNLAGQGAGGFFSYGMNIDLKREYISSEGVYVAMPYPQMPKTTALPKPSATVFMFDMAFNSKEFPYANLYYSVNPAGRWTAFARRHCAGEGGVLAFVDGHCGYFKWSYVYNQNNPAVTDIGEPLNPDIIWNPPYRAAVP